MQKYHFSELKEMQNNLMKEAKKKIIAFFEQHDEFSVVKRGGYGLGKWNNYFWIPVTNKKIGKIFWITLFRNHIDNKSGNFHTNHGEVCFVAPISADSPNMYDTKLNISLDKEAKKAIGISEESIAIEFVPDRWRSPLKYGALLKYTPLNGSYITVDDILAMTDKEMADFWDAFRKFAVVDSGCLTGDGNS